MRLWSRGLGRLVLPIHLGSARLDLTPEHVVLSGVIREGKVFWEYRVKLTERDFLGFCALAGRREVLDFLARKHGAHLLWLIAARSAGFVGGMLRKALGHGAPVVPEEDLEVGPRPGKRKDRGNGVLVEGPR